MTPTSASSAKPHGAGQEPYVSLQPRQHKASNYCQASRPEPQKPIADVLASLGISHRPPLLPKPRRGCQITR